jgi:hypothetical protein
VLGFFPRPGEDELLYSVIARYGAMTGNGVGGQLIQDFFGTAVGIAAVDLPRHIDSLVARIPPGSAWGRDRLIDRHTLFPYQLRFAPAGVAAAVRGYMAGSGGKRPARLGVMSAAFPARERLMVCPACAREDAAESGIATWRRVHQLPGVLVCPKHGGPLHESGVARLDRRGRGALIPLTREVRDAACPLALPRGAGANLLRFAVASNRLLGQGTEPCETAALQFRLRSMLAGYRWSRAPSLLHMERVVDDFLAHPGIRPLMAAINLTWTNGQVATALSPPGGVLPAHAQRQEAERMLREVLDAVGARKPDRIVAAFFAPVRRDGHSEVTMEADGLKFVVRIYDNLGMGSRALFVAEHGGRLPPAVWLNGTAK